MYKASEKLINAILNYLGTKPFVEVSGLIAELQRVEKIQELPKKAEAPKVKK